MRTIGNTAILSMNIFHHFAWQEVYRDGESDATAKTQQQADLWIMP
jgi:hypothetical protein